MTITVLDYSAAYVTNFFGCPDSWEEEEIRDFLFNADRCGFDEDDISWMAHDEGCEDNVDTAMLATNGYEF